MTSFPLLQAALTGFFVGLGLIIAIGAQNAFVLRQGLARTHVLPVVAICAASDAILIVAGVAGLGTLVRSSPILLQVATYGGALFLACYGLYAFRRAMAPSALEAAQEVKTGLSATIATCLAFTFLNPHVYLDTVVLVGSISATFEVSSRVAFGAGAAFASIIWFTVLGFGARFASPLFAKPSAWRVLDLVIGIVMTTLALSLVLSSPKS